MKTVMVFGTFDILHHGHINFLRQAGKFGKLTVVIARDKTVKEVKGKLPLHPEKRRQRAVKLTELADNIILGNLTDKYAAIKKYKPDIIALGYDQKVFTEGLAGALKELNLKTKIIRLRAFKPSKYKTSIINLDSRLRGNDKK